MVGTMDGTESVCYQMISGKFRNSYWTIPDVYDRKMP